MAKSSLKPRHELFAQNLAKGMAQGAAYEAAGFKSSDSGASRLARNVKVQARVLEIKAEIAARVIERTAVSKDWIIEQLVTVYNKSMMGNPVLNRYGQPTGDFVANYSAANRALELLGKTDDINMFTEKSEGKLTVDGVGSLLGLVDGKSRTLPTDEKETRH